MQSIALHLNFPDHVIVGGFELRMMIATQMYERGQLTLGQAAEMVGLSKQAFYEIMGQYGVSPFQQTLEEHEDDLSNV